MPILAAIALVFAMPSIAVAPYYHRAEAATLVEEPALAKPLEAAPVQDPVESPKAASKTLCSCKLYVASKVANMPLGDAQDFTGNTTPAIGVVVLFQYSHTAHMAYIERLDETGMWISETNMKHCQYSERHVDWDDPYITGFYHP